MLKMDAQIKVLKIKIEKIGRKWIQATAFGDTFQKKVKMYIDDATKAFKVGDVVESRFRVDYKKNSFNGFTEWELTYLTDEAERQLNDERAEVIIDKIREKAERYIKYIRDNINKYNKPYWYQNGETTIKEIIEELDKIEQAKEYKEDLQARFEALRTKYEEEMKAYTEQKEAAKTAEKENICIVRSFDEDGFTVGQIIERNGELYKIVKVEGWREPDSLSFGGWEDNQYMYQATADKTKVTEEDRARYEAKKREDAIRKAESEERRKIKEEKKQAERDIINEVRKKENFIGEKTNLGTIEKDAEIINDSFNNYGGGSKLIVKGDDIYYIVNNGADGDNWELNFIQTGGAGGYGYKAKMTDTIRNNIEIIKK